MFILKSFLLALNFSIDYLRIEVTMKTLKRILWIVSLFFVYLIVKEAIMLYASLLNINEYFAYAMLGILAFVIVWFVILPMIRMFAYRAVFSPVASITGIEKSMLKRNKHLRLLLTARGIELEEQENSEIEYKYLLGKLQPQLNDIRKRYVSQLFISTGVSQNGFLDAILILSASVNMIKDIFSTFNGRVSNRYLFVILRKVYLSVAIGGSEGVEYAVNELMTKLGSDTIKSIPFVNVVSTSLTDGFVNAVLLTRVALITENYCKLIYIEKDRDLFPGTKTIIETTKSIVKGSMDIFKRPEIFGEKKTNILKKWLGKE